jgi:D-glycero-D-manno-heptose 1,7-bisphosphate phosphatase
MGKAVFLDRDGTIVEDTGHLHERNKVRFLPGVDKAVRRLKENGFKVIIVTNQAGVAKGYYTEDTVREINAYVLGLLAQKGAIIDAIYYCPHHTEGVVEQYRKACYCRKPNPGMLERAATDFGIDFSQSFVIGDHLTDIEAGRRVGCQTILLASAEPVRDQNEITTRPDCIASNLYQAVKWILKTGD